MQLEQAQMERPYKKRTRTSQRNEFPSDVSGHDASNGQKFYQALEIYNGKIIASHQNCRSLVKGERQFTDDQIINIIERCIIGGALDAWMLHANLMNKDDPKKMGIGLEKLVDHFDHICQLSGNY